MPHAAHIYRLGVKELWSLARDPMMLVLITYTFTVSIYVAATESGLAWNDPDLAVAWPVTNPVISARDQGNESFAAFKARVKGL